jgi:hypothetical protein
MIIWSTKLNLNYMKKYKITYILTYILKIDRIARLVIMVFGEGGANTFLILTTLLNYTHYLVQELIFHKNILN